MEYSAVAIPQEERTLAALTHLSGLAGYIIVNDGTRPETCRISQDLNRFVEDAAGPRPHVILLNKADLAKEWALTPEIEASLAESGGLVLRTSAKTGQFVDDAFQRLAEALSTEAGYDHVGA